MVADDLTDDQWLRRVLTQGTVRRVPDTILCGWGSVSTMAVVMRKGGHEWGEHLAGEGDSIKSCLQPSILEGGEGMGVSWYF